MEISYSKLERVPSNTTPSTLISVIIAVFNSEAYLEQCINSVLKQNYRNFELIIIDGNSSDASISIIKKYQQDIAFWVSEPDKGIYDAWNKGLQVAKGEWIVFIGADDVLHLDAFSLYINHINAHPNRHKLEFVSSLIELVNADLSHVRIVGAQWVWNEFRVRMSTWHVGCFHSRHFFSKYGIFDPSYKVSGDYELLLRPQSHLIASFLPLVLVQMRTGGVSARRLWKAVDETYRAKVSNTGFPKWKAFLLIIVDKLRVHMKI